MTFHPNFDKSYSDFLISVLTAICFMFYLIIMTYLIFMTFLSQLLSWFQHSFYVHMNFHKHLRKYNISSYVAEMDFLKELPEMIEVNELFPP